MSAASVSACGVSAGFRSGEAAMTREIPLTKGRVALVDDADFERLSGFSWRLCGSENRRHGMYAVANIDGQIVRMHRLIIGASADEIVDHRNRNSLDNRRENLRICTTQQNARNRRPYLNTLTGLKGVTISRGRFQVVIGIDGKPQYLGCFGNRYEAALAYDDAAVAHFGEFAHLNFDRSRDWIINGRSVGARSPDQ